MEITSRLLEGAARKRVASLRLATECCTTNSSGTTGQAVERAYARHALEEHPHLSAVDHAHADGVNSAKLV